LRVVSCTYLGREELYFGLFRDATFGFYRGLAVSPASATIVLMISEESNSPVALRVFSPSSPSRIKEKHLGHLNGLGFGNCGRIVITGN
jgi:hypothetical protein